MKNIFILTLLLFGAMTIFAAEEKETANTEKQETTKKEEVKPNMKDFSYSLGYEMYSNNKKYKLILSPEKLLEGIDDGYAKAEMKVKHVALWPQQLSSFTWIILNCCC